MENEITPTILKSLLTERGMKHKDLEPILNLENPKISALMNGKRKISSSEQKLLKLYFYNIMPFDLKRPQEDLSNSLKFTGDEWKVITILASREGYVSPQAWITSQIRGYLRNITHTSNNTEQPHKQKLAAEQEEPYRTRTQSS